MALSKLLPALLVAATTLSGCAIFPPFANLTPRECLIRAMYFESNRIDGLGRQTQTFGAA